MVSNKKPSVDDILRKHSARIEGQIAQDSMDYLRFKQERTPELSRYEKWCKSLGSIIKLKIAEKDRQKIQKNLSIAHLDILPEQALTLSVMSFVVVFVVGLLISLSVVLINGTLASFPVLFFILVIILSLFLFYFTNNYPSRIANKWRLKASSQMVPAILYIVIYMRHTPNLEKAIAFAAEHLQPPLALDFKKVFYDVSIGRFSTIKESLDFYLDIWRDYSPEFIESFHLIESSLFEPDNNRRILILEKSLQVVLDGVYDKMLKFTHNVRSPLTNVYMLGVVLPTLALALLPLASAMIGGMIKWFHVMLLFNLIVPFFVFYLIDKIVFLRPGGYGQTDLLERNPLYPKYKSRKPYFIGVMIFLPFLILGFLPFIFQFTPVPSVFGLEKDYTSEQLGLGFFGNDYIFDFKDGGYGINGPFGVVALFLSLLVPFGLAMALAIAFKMKTADLIVEREKTIQLESEFNNSLFQLGNRVGNGVPPELVFAKVAESSKGLRTADFFRRVNYNIQQMGMSVEKAIFDRNRGAIIYYPSDLISTSMKIFIEASKKGLQIAAVSLMSISQYVKNISKITERLKDMLAEIVSDMKSNMTFLAPLLSGIVVGLAMMMTSILNKLNFSNLGGDSGSLGIGNFGTLLEIFDVTQMIPPYYLQIIVGIYLVQIIFILTGTLVTINSGEDKLDKINKTGKNLMRGILLYTITAFIAVMALFVLTSLVLGNLF